MFLKFPNSAKLLKTSMLAASFSLLLYLIVTRVNLMEKNEAPANNFFPPFTPKMQIGQFEAEGIVLEKYNQASIRSRIIGDKIKRLTGMVHQDNAVAELKRDKIEINYNIQIFYYCPVQWWAPWNKNQSLDSDLNTVFYPEMGVYNCTEDVIDKHFKQISESGVGTVIFSWYVERKRKAVIELLFKIAMKYKLRVSFLIEQFSNVDNIRNQIKYLVDEFSRFKSLNRILDWHNQKPFPLFYIKGSNNLTDVDWRRIFSHKGDLSLRNTKYDSYFIGLLSHKDDMAFLRRSYFDGFFTYLSSNGAQYGSTWKNWHHAAHFADQYKMLFIPTVGPGYNEKFWKNRPDQKSKHTSCRHRSGGNYYGVAWRTINQLNHVQFVTISSFNNWPEGNQIEPAIVKESFQDYAPKMGNYSSIKYLELTRYWIGEFVDHVAERNQHHCVNWLNNTNCHPKRN